MRAASSSAAITRIPRTLMMDQHGTPVSAAIRPHSLNSRFNPKLDWGPAATDVRQLASFNGSYELPFGPHHRFLNHASRPVNFLASGWTASAIVAVQTGFPSRRNSATTPPAMATRAIRYVPNWNPNFSGTLYPRTPQQYFNAAAFLPPATGTYGNVSRDCADRRPACRRSTFRLHATRI